MQNICLPYSALLLSFTFSASTGSPNASNFTDISQHHGRTGLVSPGAMPPMCFLISSYSGSPGL